MGTEAIEDPLSNRYLLYPEIPIFLSLSIIVLKGDQHTPGLIPLRIALPHSTCRCPLGGGWIAQLASMPNSRNRVPGSNPGWRISLGVRSSLARRIAERTWLGFQMNLEANPASGLQM